MSLLRLVREKTNWFKEIYDTHVDMFDIGLVKPNHEWVWHPIVYVFVITYPYPSHKTDLDYLSSLNSPW